jgi:ribulose-5-phosphate 4-epimerase/fuculose-1-phosphate aldolase
MEWVVASGKDLATAFQRLETVGQFARILLTPESFGGPNLQPREVQKLILRKVA